MTILKNGKQAVLGSVAILVGCVTPLLAWDFEVYNHTPYTIYFMATFIGAAPNIREGQFVIPAGSKGQITRGGAHITGVVSATPVNKNIKIRTDTNSSIATLNLNAANSRLYGINLSSDVALDLPIERTKDGKLAMVPTDAPTKARKLFVSKSDGQSLSHTYHVYVQYALVGDRWQELLNMYRASATGPDL